MRRATVLALLAAAAALASSARDVEVPNLAGTTQSVIELANGFRHGEHRRTLVTSEMLTATAREFAAYMARTDRFDHEADGREPAERAREHGYSYCVLSENIAFEYSSRGFTTEELARRFVEGWKHSPGHRANLLDNEVVETGAAVAHSARSGRYYAVQMFGRPGCARGRPKVY
ncbi:MAG: CAP domain-containing protein [Bacillota bacterium]